MEVKLKTDDPKRRYREYEVSGDISVQNIDVLINSLKDSVKDCDDIAISLKQISGFDVAAFQMLLSIKNSYIRDKKQFTVTSELEPEVQQLLQNCGIENLDQALSIKA